MWKDLFSISWWRQSFNSLSAADIHQRWSQIVAVFHNPQINPVMFLMILAVIVVAVLIVVLTIVMIVSSRMHRDRYALVDDQGKEVSKLPSRDAKATAVRGYRASWKRYSTLLWIIVVLLVLFVSVGAGTSTSGYCRACHGHDKKVAVMQSGSHAKTSCVQCHENGGFFSRYTVGSFQRIGHTLTGLSTNSQPTGYATVPADACLRCHSNTKTGRIVSNVAGNNTITVSHKEPYEARMDCTRCHNLTTAKSAAASSTSMDTCLICHNGTKASDACVTCHVNSPQLAVATSTPSPQNADRLVGADPKTQCYTCHAKDAASCDACHGMRIPHPAGFADNHASAVSSYGLAACMRCHKGTAVDSNQAAGMAGSCAECHSYDQTSGRWDFQ